MKALIREADTVQLADIPTPRIQRDDEVLVRIELVGICRTDIYAALGHLACQTPVTLGHEFSGIVQETGALVDHVQPGDRVVAMPLKSCGGCDGPCQWLQMMGVDFHGAFAEFIVVPSDLLFVVPQKVPPKLAAYVEPLAASMAPLDKLRTSDRGLVLGDGRIAQLTLEVLQTAGFESVEVGRGGSDGSFDFVVETDANSLGEAIRLARVGGTVILKSRPSAAVSFDLLNAVRKELTLHGAHYGSFQQAIDWLATDKINVDSILGPVHPMTDDMQFFERLLADETHKHFFDPRR